MNALFAVINFLLQIPLMEIEHTFVYNLLCEYKYWQVSNATIPANPYWISRSMTYANPTITPAPDMHQWRHLCAVTLHK